MQNKMWLKRVLVPFWAIEMLWLLATLVIAGLGLYENETHMVGGKEVALHKIVSLAAILLLAMSAISIIFDLAAIVLFARHKLQPVTFLVLSCIKSIFWIFIFAVDIADAVRGDTAGLVAAFALSAVLFLTSVGQIVYGAVVHHRKRKGITGRGNYGGVGGAGAGYRGADYDRTPRASVSYANGGAPPNPFRDPSREPSPAAAQRVPLTAAQEPSLSHPAFRKSGENETYYNNEPPHASFEMTTAYRDS